KLDDAIATLEAANHVSPGDLEVLRELVEISAEAGDHEACARHLEKLASKLTRARKGDSLLQLADIYYAKLDHPARARATMRAAAEAFGGTRRETTLRLLATESASHLAWEVAVDALTAITVDRRTMPDTAQLATALQRAGKIGDAIRAIEEATSAGRYD